MKYYVNETCIGCGLCNSICPNVFSMSDNDTAEAIDENVDASDVASAQEAMESCPVSAIEEKKWVC